MHGNKNIRDYKDASADYEKFKAGGSHDKFNDELVSDAEKAYNDFQASISDKLSELKAKVDKAKAGKQYDLDKANLANARKQNILNNVRDRRNQNK